MPVYASVPSNVRDKGLSHRKEVCDCPSGYKSTSCEKPDTGTPSETRQDEHQNYNQMFKNIA